MTQYLLAVHGSPETYPPEEEMQEVFEAVNAVNAEMEAAGVWVFGGGLEDASTATVVHVTGGQATTTDGPYLETKEHLGGFWILELADLDEALSWAKKASAACRGAIEVRPFQPEDQPEAG